MLIILNSLIIYIQLNAVFFKSNQLNEHLRGDLIRYSIINMFNHTKLNTNFNILIKIDLFWLFKYDNLFYEY